MRRRFVQVEGKLIEVQRGFSQAPRHDHSIQTDIEPYRSPIDGSTITSRSHEREHMRRHGVTHADDFSPEYMAQRSKERTDRLFGQSKDQIEQRKRDVARALDEVTRG